MARTRFKAQSHDFGVRFILCSWSHIPFEDSGGTANPLREDGGAFADPERPGKIYRVIND